MIGEPQVVRYVRDALGQRSGGRIVATSAGVLRQARVEAAVRAWLDDATLLVAADRTLVWASRLAGQPLPGPVIPRRLLWSLAAGLAADGRSVFLLGGAPGDRVRAAGADRAAARLARRYPGLRIAGCLSPQPGFDTAPRAAAAACTEVIEAKPDLCYVGLGFAAQESLISRLRPDLPGTWFLGCGPAIDLAAEDPVVPRWLPAAGRDWLRWVRADPGRLSPARLRRDVPHTLRIFADAAHARGRGRHYRGRG